jgi:hypothetical protein
MGRVLLLRVVAFVLLVASAAEPMYKTLSIEYASKLAEFYMKYSMEELYILIDKSAMQVKDMKSAYHMSNSHPEWSKSW